MTVVFGKNFSLKDNYCSGQGAVIRTQVRTWALHQSLIFCESQLTHLQIRENILREYWKDYVSNWEVVKQGLTQSSHKLLLTSLLLSADVHSLLLVCLPTPSRTQIPGWGTRQGSLGQVSSHNHCSWQSLGGSMCSFVGIFCSIY